MSPKQIVSENGTKVCSVCKTEKILEDFSKDHRVTTGRSSRCKQCSYDVNKKRYNEDSEYRARVNKSNINGALKRRYGITLEERNELLKEQNNRCVICSVEFEKCDEVKTPHVDHDHSTGKVRGLLCTLCNVGLGSFRDNINFLSSAISYLKETYG